MRYLVFEAEIVGMLYGARAPNTSVRTTRNGMYGLRLVHTVRCANVICYIRKWNVACDLVILFTWCDECGCDL